ncbi:unnamed protein product [Owenia fusiformis]|uniref:Phosphatidate cytidylyltransferase n=1 Tax=Owenia fusiformis TaxID=6347 RepID=A0A8J1Y5V1_OWEFU|nr:unnamed protein product [Owenia fusiformis]
MSEVRQRQTDGTSEIQNQNEPTKETGDNPESTKDEEGITDPDNMIDLNAASSLPQDTGKTTDVLDSALKDLTPRWRNWIIRGIFSWVMILGFGFIIYMGPLALVLLILMLQIKCFHEIITIGYQVYKSHDLPWFRTLSWYFLVTSNYFFFGESMIDYFGVLLSRPEIPWLLQHFMQPFVTYHRFISFSLYVAGFVGFVFSLVKKHYLQQFTLFGWTHVTLLIVVTQSHLIMQNIFEGLIWFLVPVSMIICNDIWAYIFGFFFGKTPLIKLSPKKTWEGFLGGAFATVIFGIVLSNILMRWDFFVCPIEYSDELGTLSMECIRSHAFTSQEYNLKFMKVQMYPFTLHTIALSTFASIIGPFGGFFASGFKRAFKIKDFGDTIPGHGGLMDRFDCQFLMGAYVHVYFYSFIRVANPTKLLQNVLAMKAEDQLAFYNLLKQTLTSQGIVQEPPVEPPMQ